MTNYHVFRQCLLVMTVIALYPDVKGQALNPKDYRLPKYITPIRYDIDLNIKTFIKDSKASNSFDGEVIITFQVKDKAEDAPIILNSHFLQIKEVQLDGEKIEPTRIKHLEKLERLQIDAILKKDDKNHTLTFTYQAKMDKTMKGLYYGFYTQQGPSNRNQTFWFIKTQMAPVYARSVFPCFDEPTFKAIFKLSICYPKIFKVAMSNTATTTNTHTGDLMKRTFEETPEMSPHLVGFALFENLKKDDSRTIYEINYEIGFRPHLKHAYQYALGISADIVKVYEDLTGISYKDASNSKIRKVEQIGLPHCLQGAVENWGLTSYREELFFWDTEQSPAEAKQAIATKIAYNLGQIWFGNLKTPKWWNVWWISKGFATFYQSHVLAEVEKTWELQDYPLIEVLQAMHSDFASGRPLTLPEASILDSQSIVMATDSTFDLIAPFKGAAIIHMLKMLMGRDIFNKGVKIFMSQKRPDIVTPRYLWDSWKDEDLLNEVFPKPLTEIMESWTQKAGFPIVSVIMKGKQLEISAVGIDDSLNLNTQNSSWYIPITYTTSKDPSNFFNTAPKKSNWVMKTEKLVLNEDLSSPRSWIVVNLQSAAYMRVNYDKTLWTRLEVVLRANPTPVHILNRIQIVDDVISLALLEKLPFSLAFRVLGFLKYEVDYLPWYTAIKGFATLRQTLEDDQVATLNTYLRTLFTNFYKSISNDITHAASLKRAFAHKAACEMNNRECLKQMTQKFKEFVNGGVEVEPNLRFVVYCTGLRSKDGIQFWDTLYTRMIETKVPSEETIIANALACTDNVNQLKQYLGHFLNKHSQLNPHNSEDVKNILLAIITNSRRGSEALMEFLDENSANVARYQEFMNISILHLAFAIKSKSQLDAMRHLAEKSEMAPYASLFEVCISISEKAWTRTEHQRTLITGSLRTRPQRKSAGVIPAAARTLLLLLLATSFFGIS